RNARIRALRPLPIARIRALRPGAITRIRALARHRIARIRALFNAGSNCAIFSAEPKRRRVMGDHAGSNNPDLIGNAATPSPADRTDFEDAARGFVASLSEPIIRGASGSPVWDLTSYGFLDAEASPPTVNPSLWRMARLNMHHGLFQVTERVWQVR